MIPVDDELLSAYLDGELQAREARAVEGLLRQNEGWRQRLQTFRADAELLRSMPDPQLSPQTRDIVYRSIKGSFPMGSERRRVPRYKRRWMLLAAFAVPCLLTLLYLQSPARDARLYLRGAQLALRSGRSGEKSILRSGQSWVSPPLWGKREGSDLPSLSFQVDAGELAAQSVLATVTYDFDGDGKPDRVERYEAAATDDGEGWERLRPALDQAEGELRDFQGGRVTVRLDRGAGQSAALELSGAPGELVLPYCGLRARP